MKNIFGLIVIACLVAPLLHCVANAEEPLGETSAWINPNAHPLEVAAWISKLR